MTEQQIFKAYNRHVAYNDMQSIVPMPLLPKEKFQVIWWRILSHIAAHEASKENHSDPSFYYVSAQGIFADYEYEIQQEMIKNDPEILYYFPVFPL